MALCCLGAHTIGGQRLVKGSTIKDCAAPVHSEQPLVCESPGMGRQTSKHSKENVDRFASRFLLAFDFFRHKMHCKFP